MPAMEVPTPTSTRAPAPAGAPSPTRTGPGRTPIPPRAGVRRTPLVMAVVLVVAGSLAPWVDTPFGDVGGLAGPGLWTLYASAFGIAAVVLRRPRLAAGHAVAMGLPAVVLPLWQLGRLIPLGGFGTGWFPGVGLVAVVGGGVLAARTAVRLWRG